MSLTDELIKKIEELSDSEREKVARFIESMKERSPLERFTAYMDELSAGIPDEELQKIPADLAGSIDKYAYEINLNADDRD